jgi:hypothetical protein
MGSIQDAADFVLRLSELYDSYLRLKPGSFGASNNLTFLLPLNWTGGLGMAKQDRV